MSAENVTSYGREAWRFSNTQVEVTVTKRGGMMAPVTFYRDSAEPIEPYYVSPWQAEGRELNGDVLDSLRGDFFCLPFGWPSEEAGISYAPHGEPPGSDWSEPKVETHGAVTSLESEVRTEKPEGTVRKRVNLVDGQNSLYVSHELKGYDVRTPLGHHAILDCSRGVSPWAQRSAALRISGCPTTRVTRCTSLSSPLSGSIRSNRCRRYGRTHQGPIARGFPPARALWTTCNSSQRKTASRPGQQRCVRKSGFSGSPSRTLTSFPLH